MKASSEDVVSPPNVPANTQRKGMTLLAMAAVGDWLLYDHKPGISVVLFVALLGVGVLIANPVKASYRSVIRATGLLIIALSPLVEDYSLVALAFAAIGAACFALVMTQSYPTTFARQLTEAVRLLLTGPLQCVRDLGLLRETDTRSRFWSKSVASATKWIVPLCVGGVFVALFASANPLIEDWLSRLNLFEIIRGIDFQRVMFWAALSLGIWPLIFQTARFGNSHRNPDSDLPQDDESQGGGGLFGSAAILRSLALFNALFLVETILDLTYLWSGVALPDGMSYASYAHRGAYPLILTALLAGGFVITALKPGSRSEASPVIRSLVYVWIFQNILLVVSAMARLKSYVDTYSLTYWRVAAFIWMMLVAVGLVLLILRIARRRSNAWLIRSNGGALAVALYACCLLNFPSVVAAYNVDHCREIAGQGQPLDLAYLVTLGPGIIPAMDDYRRRLPEGYRAFEIRSDREQLRSSFLLQNSDWRQWGFRRWRLSRYIEKTGAN